MESPTSPLERTTHVPLSSHQTEGASSSERSTASIVFVRLLVDALERRQISRADLMGEDGPDTDRLADASVRVDLSEYEVLLARTVELTGDEALGLRIVEQASESAFGLMAPVVSNASTLREGIALCCRFAPILMDEGGVVLREHGDLATLRYDFLRRTPLFDRVFADFVLCGLFRMMRAFGGPHATVVAACFEHVRPKYHREYARVFGGAERFSQPFTTLSFSRSLLDRPQLHRHGELSAVLRLQAEREITRISRGLDEAGRVRQYLLVQRPSRLPDVKTAARDMGISARSMRRMLARKGVSYRALVQSVRETLAARMLSDQNTTIQEVAYALGFSDSTAFHRAFKRWKGATPATFQKFRDI